MLVFLAVPLSEKVRLSNEHTEFAWVHIDEAKKKVSEFYHAEIELFNKFYRQNWMRA
jgi:hypothetical protein